MNNELYPVYFILFSNDTTFGKLIRKATGSNYSHATISLDTSMNNMYSFSTIPFSKAIFSRDGFVRESLWSPMYNKNRYFTVMVTFVNKEGLNNIKKKIDYFVDHYVEMKYNTIGIIQYYLNFKNTKNHNEEKKKTWFCSEFTAYMLDCAHVKGFNDILQAPEDLKNVKNPNVFNLGDFTIPTFKEADLKVKTEIARKKFLQNNLLESYTQDVDELFESAFGPVYEGLVDLFKKNREKYSEFVLAQYTAIIDWKRLYDEFCSYFTNTDPEVRFDLFEMIIRKVLIPAQTNAREVTNNIINELRKIHNMISGHIITAVDVTNAWIYTKIGRVRNIFSYPDLHPMRESFGTLESLNEVLGELDDGNF